MKKPLERLAFFGVALVVLLIAVLFVAGSVTEQRRDSAVAEFRKRLSTSHASAGQSHTSEEPGLSANAQAPTMPNPAERIEAFEHVFEAYGEVEASDTWRACKSLVEKWPPSKWSAEEWEAARSFVTENADFLAQAQREAMQGGPVCEIDLSRGWECDMRNILLAGRLARMLTLATLVHNRDGDASRTEASIAAILHLGDAVMDGRAVLTAHIISSDIGELAAKAVLYVYPRGSLSEKQTRVFVDLIPQLGGRQAYAESILGEGEMLLGSFSQIRSSDELLPSLWSSAGAPWLQLDEAACADFMGRFAEAAAKPYYEAAPIVEEIVQEIRELPPTRVMTRLALPNLFVSSRRQARHEARLDLMRIGLLAERYQADHGAPPASLDVLAPALGGTVPVDPFTGEAYRYEVQDGTFRLSSAGQGDSGEIVWRGEE